MKDDAKLLEDLRKEIDALDEQLLHLLADRMEKVRGVGAYKKAHGLPPLDEARWHTVLETRINEAKSQHLSEEFIAELYQLIHDYALKIESED
jgi:chorismate mutase